MQSSNKTKATPCRLRCASAALLISSALVCVTACCAWAASSALWIADYGSVAEYLPSQLKRISTPTPLSFSIGAYVYGVCFDKSHNLWVTDGDNEILEFAASKLKKLPKAPTAKRSITSTSFSEIAGCTFDKHDNLWLADLENNSLDEISSAQLKAGRASVTPKVIITDATQMSEAAPGFVTFDKSGNLWTDGREDDELFEFSASQLTSSGDKEAAVVLGGGGSFADPGQIVFDGDGNLWVTSWDDDTLLMFSKSQLSASNDDAPSTTINSSSLDGPWGVAFESGNLWVLDYNDGSLQMFEPSQLTISGSPPPKILWTDAESIENWEITSGPALGKLP